MTKQFLAGPRSARPLVACLLLGAGLFLGACGSQTETEEVEFHVPVTVREVELGTVESLIVTTGTLRARPELRKPSPTWRAFSQPQTPLFRSKEKVLRSSLLRPGEAEFAPIRFCTNGAMAGSQMFRSR